MDHVQTHYNVCVHFCQACIYSYSDTEAQMTCASILFDLNVVRVEKLIIFFGRAGLRKLTKFYMNKISNSADYGFSSVLMSSH